MINPTVSTKLIGKKYNETYVKVNHETAYVILFSQTINGRVFWMNEIPRFRSVTFCTGTLHGKEIDKYQYRACYTNRVTYTYYSPAITKVTIPFKEAVDR